MTRRERPRGSHKERHSTIEEEGGPHAAGSRAAHRPRPERETQNRPSKTSTPTKSEESGQSGPASEVKICGLRAVRAVESTRREDVVRVYLVEERIAQFAELLRWCAEQRRAYRVVTTEDLDRVADTRHHEGICAVVRERAPRSLDDALRGVRDRETWVLLDSVRNPHNLGGIFRTAAHFGASTVLVAGEGSLLTPSAYRTAEGGAEHVETIPFEASSASFAKIKASGFSVIATSSRVTQSLFDVSLPPRALFVFGAEDEGISRSVLMAADERVAIPGSGRVDSLNVSCSVAVVLAEAWRQGLGMRGGAQREPRARSSIAAASGRKRPERRPRDGDRGRVPRGRRDPRTR